jgi:hypothetical protein
MSYKFQIRRKPGRVAYLAADLLLALACFGALQALDTTATATATASSVADSPTQSSASSLSIERPGDAAQGQGVRETVVGDIEHASAP